MILLVEDSEDDVFLFERAMKRANVSLPMYNARDGQEAIDYLQAKGKFEDRKIYPLPSIVILDLKLPNIHGLDVLRWIKRQPSLSGVPVLMLTSSLEERDKQNAMTLGAKGFFIKPPTPQVFAEMFSLCQS
jgi:CheY-like chemotaxis protein